MKWKTLASEVLFSDLWFTVRKDTCETPAGKIVTPYYVYEFPTWVTAVAITKEGKVILEKQYRHALGEVCWEIPGGCVDVEDANLETAIKRELLEETGYTFDEYIYLGQTSANPSTNNNLMHMFLATGGVKTSEQSLDPNEEIEVHLVDIAAVKQMLLQQEFVQSMHATCLMHALLHLKLLS